MLPPEDAHTSALQHCSAGPVPMLNMDLRSIYTVNAMCANKEVSLRDEVVP